MTKDHSKSNSWVVRWTAFLEEEPNKLTSWIVLLGVILVLYAVPSYLSIFEHRVGYVYHPKTDRIYSVKLAASLDSQLEPFVPFHSLYYGEPDGAEYLGRLHQLLSLDPDALLDQKFQQMEEEIKTGKFLELLDLEYFIRMDVAPDKLLPKSLAELTKSGDNEPSSFRVVDAFTSLVRMNGERPRLELLSPALLIRGAVAFALYKKLNPGEFE